jgi:hypothetical protein
MAEAQAPETEWHLEPHEVAGYVAGRLSADERRRTEAHLADCAPCAEEVVAVARLAGPRRSFRRWLPAAAVAAALVGIAVLLPPGKPGSDVVRDGGSGPKIAVVVPPDGGTVAGRPSFVWRRVEGASTYRLTVTGESGDSIWAMTTADTSLAVPREVTLRAGKRYYWYVDALLSDGGSLSTGILEFVAAQ